MSDRDATATDLSLASENERLRAELRARLDELRACRGRLVRAIEAERRRIERDLHDGIQARLVSLAMSLGLLDAKLLAHDTAKPIARTARREAASALEELRLFSHGLYPSVLAKRGLQAAIEELRSRTALPAHVDLALPSRLSEHVEAATYFLISEALTNATKHSHATEIRMVALHHEQRVTIEVTDNGIGGAAITSGSGLRNLTARIEALGGRFDVSSPAGQGTALRAEIPCA
jgi:signal transduction histidine kinase